jgi:chromate transporter
LPQNAFSHPRPLCLSGSSLNGAMTEPPPPTTDLSPRVSLRELARLFLRLGITSFGGPAAHIALMEEEVVRRRRWLTHAEFLDLLGAVNLIPGPNSTEMAIHIGARMRGAAGLVVAGLCFTLPATFLVALLAWMYVRYRELPALGHFLYGVKPVMLAVVLQALWNLGRACLRDAERIALAVAAVGVYALGLHELIVLFGAGVVLMIVRSVRSRNSVSLPSLAPGLGLTALPLVGASATGAAAVATPVGVWPLFLFFLKVGSVLFGSGYVLLAFLRADLVERYGWLTEEQLLDALAVGQVTPGPLFSTATFIGYLLAGPAGAAAATVGIFLPAFVFVILSRPLIPRLRRSRLAGAFLDGVNVASLALIAVVTVQLSLATLVDVPTVLLLLVSAVLLLRYRVSSFWLILGGALTGWLIKVIGV